jgi:ATP-binding cassette, subfamily C (CFTR/MRP), member 1
VYVLSLSKLKRFEAITKSPIFSHFGETLSGQSTIKAYKMKEHFIKMLDKKLNDNSKFLYIFNYSQK